MRRIYKKTHKELTKSYYATTNHFACVIKKKNKNIHIHINRLYRLAYFILINCTSIL